MKYFINILIITLISLLWSCTCEEDITLIPEAPDPFLITQIVEEADAIYIHFNKILDRASVQSASLQVNGEGLSYSGVFIVDDNTIIIPACQIQCATTDCTFQLLLSGQKETAIKSETGQLLDGNKDGTDGEDYLDTLEIKNCQFPEITCGPTGIIYTQEILEQTVFTSFCFSESMNPNTIIVGKALNIVASGGEVFQPSLNWIDNFTQLDLMFYAPCYDPGSPTYACSCNIDFTLNGNLAKSKKGFQLDADADGLAGGVYKSTMEIQQLVFPYKGSFIGDGYSFDFIFTDSSHQLSINIGFTRAIDPSTLKIGKNVSITCLKTNNIIPFTTLFNQQNTEVILTSTDSFTCFGEIQIEINQNSVEILDECHGKAIDADQDGKPGGNFSYKIYI